MATTIKNSPPAAKPLLQWRRNCIILVSTLATLVVILYVALSPMVAKPIYEHKLFRHPMQSSAAYAPVVLQGVKGEDCWVTSNNGTRLHGLLFTKPGAKATTLIHHGADGNILFFKQIAEFMLATNSSVFLYDYEGYGRSEGHTDVNNLSPDGIAAYDYLVNQAKIPADQIINMGISLGTGVACEVANARPCAGVILLSPYSSFLSLARTRMPLLNIYPDFCFPCRDIEALSFVRKLHPPILIFHGCRDIIVPVEQADNLVTKALQPVRYVRYEDAGHVGFFGYHLKETLANVTNFVDRVTHLEQKAR